MEVLPVELPQSRPTSIARFLQSHRSCAKIQCIPAVDQVLQADGMPVKPTRPYFLNSFGS